MAERTTQSWTTVPHFFLSRDVDATALNAMREAMTGITHTDLLVALVARALRKHPRLNSGSADVNVAIAIAVEDAVVTGVIHRADASSLAGIASRRKELSERARAGKLKWEFKLLSPPWTGLLSTAGGLVFGGTEEGNFFALDAETGKPLWDLQLGGAVKANPISFGVDGKQYIAIAAGYAIFVFGL